MVDYAPAYFDKTRLIGILGIQKHENGINIRQNKILIISCG